MVPYLGDFAEDETVYIYFNTFDSNDPSASVTLTTLIASDIYVYKDGNVADLVTDGASITVDFDSRTGVHKIEIDTSAHADYAVGSDYMVYIDGATVDAGSINGAVATFSIENRYNAAADDLANATDGLGALKALIDTLTTNVATVDTVVDGIQTDLDNGTDGLGAIKAETALIVADTNELQTDDVPGLIAALNDPTAAAVADAVWDEDATAHQTTGTFGQAIGDPGANTETIYDAVVTDAAGTNVAADIVAVKAETALIVADTGELQTNQGNWLTVTGHATEAKQDTAQADLDIITDTDGVILGAAGVDLIWDEVLTGATHNVTNSAGKRLRQIDAAFEVHSGTAQAGSTSTTIKLDTGADSTNNNIYRGDRCVIVGGTGVGEHGIIISYVAATRVATMSETWVVTPDATSEFVLVPADVDMETWNHSAVTGDGDWATVSSEVTAIKVPTDKMVFTKTNELDVNTKSINDAEVVGDGNATPWDGI